VLNDELAYDAVIDSRSGENRLKAYLKLPVRAGAVVKRNYGLEWF
jgi:hypothetical protein